MMYQYYISIAGIRLLMEIDYPVKKNEEFLPFLVQKTITDVDVSFCGCGQLPPVPEQVLFTGKCYQIAVDAEGNRVKVYYESPEDPVYYAMSMYDSVNRRIVVKYLESYRRCVSELKNCFYLLGFESILLERNKFCLHAACVETPLGGILFSGVSGIGKSTQADLWCRYRDARQINGDRPVLSKENDGWMAWGSPYAGSSRYHVNDKCEIKVIVMLKQAKNCSVRKLTLAEAFRVVWAGLTVSNWDTLSVEKASSLVINLVTTVPVFEFSCTPDESAVDYLEQIMRKEINL